jgi:IS5 family transposase
LGVYAVSQRIRKRVEEIFGWSKTVGGMAKTRYRGLARVAAHVLSVMTAYNLIRMARIESSTA